MGGRNTKIEGSFLPGTSAAQHVPSQEINRTEQTTSFDPRSPSGLRTPINLPSQRVCTNSQLVPVEVEHRSGSDKPFDILRKRFLKGFTYNNDPRSPSLHLNRTPLVFEDSHDRTLDLDDTFADLFVEPNGGDPLVEDVLVVQEDTEMPECSMPTEETEVKAGSPICAQQQFDPRSPSIGVERTPIILCDDDNDINEDVFLENILATLTLNLDASANSSFVSLKSSDANEGTGTEENNVLPKLANKHLDRVRVAKKTISKVPHRRQNRILRQKIYEDCENQLPLSPQVKSSKIDIINSPKGARTPLSCVRNRSQLRSRSVESSTRSVKTHFPLKSFDDALNPGENKNVATINIICDGSQD